MKRLAELWDWTPYLDGYGRWHSPAAVGARSRVVPLPLSTGTLLAGGCGRRQIDALVEAGALTRIRRGWYAGAGVDPRLIAAVRQGTTLTCHSALAVLGVWTVDDPRLHVRTPMGRNSLRVPATHTLVEHRTHRHRPVSATATCVDSAEDALRVAAGCLDEEQLTVAADSALQLGLISPATFEALVRSLPKAPGRRLQQVDGRAQSGTETRVRLFCARLGLTVTPQFEFLPGCYADLLVGERLVIELDSEAFHSTRQERERDAERTAQLQALGYYPVRLTYRQVWELWDDTVALLRILISRGEHRWAGQALRRAN